VARIVIAYHKTGLLPLRVPPVSSTEPLFVLDDAAVARSFDDDAVLDQLLAAAEQQISVVKEALSVGKQLDTGGGGGEGVREQPTRRGKRQHAPKVGDGPAGELLLSAQEESELEGIRILTRAEAEAKLDAEVLSLQAAKDSAADEFESRGKHVVALRDEHSGIKTFLQDALRSSKDATDMQRKVNMLTQAKQGNLAPKGLALEDVLYEKKKQSSPSKASQKTSPASHSDALAEADVLERADLKKSAAGLVARKRAEERRLLKMKEAEDRRLMELASAS
jgi:hypothetical protein